jgi:threonine dehydrogenase-like Zn-dependent dehydrogenase
VVLKGLRRVAWALDGGSRRCAVIGAGPLGHLVAKTLAHRGHTVTAIDRNPRRLELFESTAIATRLDVGDLTSIDVAVEVTGNPEVLDAAFRAAGAGTTFLLLGLPYGQTQFSFEAIAAYDKTVVGSIGSTRQDFTAALDLLPKLDLESYFRCALPLERFSDAWRISKEGDVLKVMLDVA